MSRETPSEGRIAVVVGGGGELGRATAVKLASQGLTVVRSIAMSADWKRCPKASRARWPTPLTHRP